ARFLRASLSRRRLPVSTRPQTWRSVLFSCSNMEDVVPQSEYSLRRRESMPSSLRSNVLISTVAMVLVGVTRPAFNFVINRAFGSEINGRAAAIIALIFLASLPATAALPTVMVRHVSRTLGAGKKAEAAGHAALALRWTLVLAALCSAGALVHAHFFGRT